MDSLIKIAAERTGNVVDSALTGKYALTCPVVPADAPLAMPCQSLELPFARRLGLLIARVAQGA
jgi:hypothetical protein